MNTPTIGIVAGEASGDQLGAHLMDSLSREFPDVQFVGVAGPKMQSLGAKSLYPMEALSVRGYAEVLRHLPRILGIRRGLAEYFTRNRPDCFVGIDAPSFNLGLEATLRQAGVKTIQYVSPQIWAWRGDRIHQIKRAVDLVLTLFPFEAKIYEAAGVPVEFVGHPVADALPMEPDKSAMRQKLGWSDSELLIALLPGSRVSELQYHAELFVSAAEAMLAEEPRAIFVVPLATSATYKLFERALCRGARDSTRYRLLDGQAQQALAAADVALVASGTATLESMLQKCPMVITYRLSRLSYYLISRKKTMPFVGMPNVLANEFIVPELVQDSATPTSLAREVLRLLGDPARRVKMLAKFKGLHASLAQNNSARVVDAMRHFLIGGRGDGHRAAGPLSTATQR